jgi:hypothetical protein
MAEPNHLTHAEWELIEECCFFHVGDDRKAWLTAMEKIHPISPTISNCGHDCNDCFKRCHGYYPGEAHHSGEATCPRTIQLDRWAAENYEGFDDEMLTDECSCNCQCLDDKHGLE